MIMAGYYHFTFYFALVCDLFTVCHGLLFVTALSLDVIGWPCSVIEALPGFVLYYRQPSL